ncbi:MAG: hypothetical protein ABEJ42_08145 [Halobacteriaceae archaeon]
MIRVVLAVVLSAALLAVALPAVEDARRDRIEADLRTAASGVASTLAQFAAHSDPVPLAAAGARRRLSVDVPSGPGARSPAVFLGGLPDGRAHGDGPRSDVVAVGGVGRSARVVARLPVDLRRGVDGAPAADDVPIRLRADVTLLARLVRYEGRPTVLVGRPTATGSEGSGA